MRVIDRFKWICLWLLCVVVLNLLNFDFLRSKLDFFLLTIIIFFNFHCLWMVFFFFFEFCYFSLCSIQFYDSFRCRLVYTELFPSILNFHSFDLNFADKYLTSLNKTIWYFIINFLIFSLTFLCNFSLHSKIFYKWHYIFDLIMKIW